MCCRPETKMWSPQVIEEGKVNPFKINLEAEKQVSVTEKKNKCTIFYFYLLIICSKKLYVFFKEEETLECMRHVEGIFHPKIILHLLFHHLLCSWNTNSYFLEKYSISVRPYNADGWDHSSYNADRWYNAQFERWFIQPQMINPFQQNDRCMWEQ